MKHPTKGVQKLQQERLQKLADIKEQYDGIVSKMNNAKSSLKTEELLHIKKIESLNKEINKKSIELSEMQGKYDSITSEMKRNEFIVNSLQNTQDRLFSTIFEYSKQIEYIQKMCKEYNLNKISQQFDIKDKIKELEYNKLQLSRDIEKYQSDVNKLLPLREESNMLEKELKNQKNELIRLNNYNKEQEVKLKKDIEDIDRMWHNIEEEKKQIFLDKKKLELERADIKLIKDRLIEVEREMAQSFPKLHNI